MTQLPIGWVEVRTDEAGRIDLGRQRAPRYHDGDNMKPYLRVANIFEDRIDASDLKTMHFEPADFERFRLHPGEVLLNEGQSPEWLGRPAIYRGEPPNVAFTNSLLRFRCASTVLPDWALIVFRHHMHSGRFVRESRITTNIAHLSANRLAGVEFRIPPIAEQERIIAAVDEAFSKLDAGEAAVRTVRQRLLRLRGGALAAAVTGRLVPQDSTDTPAVKLLAEIGVEPLKPGDDLPALPHSWAWAALGDIAGVVGGVTKDSKRQDDPSFVEVPYLRVANVQRGYLDLAVVATIRVSGPKAEQLALIPGDVLFNEGGDRDKLGHGWVWSGELSRCIHQNHVFRARMAAGVEPRLVSWWGNTFGKDWFESRGKQTTNLASLNLKTLRSFPVPIAPQKEQLRIAEEVERQFSFIAACERSVDSITAQSGALRRSVLKAAFEGRLVPQDSADEPAALPSDQVRAGAESRSARQRPTVSS